MAAPTDPDQLAMLARKQRTLLKGPIDIYNARTHLSHPNLRFSESRSDLSMTIPWLRSFQHADLDIRKLFVSLFSNRLNIGDEDRWFPVRPLGNGSFGAVALFEHLDAQDNIDDYVVVKSTEVDDRSIINQNLSQSSEASIMIQTNNLDSDGILFLRNYKSHASGKWRFYFEYCPSLELEQLRLVYKAWNRYLPEYFLWYLFHGLATGLAALEQGPFYVQANGTSRLPDAYVLHNDMKGANVLLGYTTEGEIYERVAQTFRYPHPKIADFGLSCISTPEEIQHARLLRGRGSGFWRVPEIRAFSEGAMREDTPFYPFYGDVPAGLQECVNYEDGWYDKTVHRITAKANVFVVGFMMYEMLTLDEPNALSDRIDKLLREEEIDPGGCCITDSMLATALRPVDLRLVLLIRRCLMLDPHQRPTGDEVRIELERIMQVKFLNNNSRLEREFTANPEQCFTDNEVISQHHEINEMEPGNFVFHKGASFWRYFRKLDNWRDPSAGEGPLRPPWDDRAPVPADILAPFAPKEWENRSLLGRRPRADDADSFPRVTRRRVSAQDTTQLDGQEDATADGPGRVFVDPNYVPSDGSSLEPFSARLRRLAAEQAGVMDGTPPEDARTPPFPTASYTPSPYDQANLISALSAVIAATDQIVDDEALSLILRQVDWDLDNAERLFHALVEFEQLDSGVQQAYMRDAQATIARWTVNKQDITHVHPGLLAAGLHELRVRNAEES